MPEDCTTLSSLDLKEVTERIYVGGNYWGSQSTAWLSLFYVHCIVFIVLFIAVNCWCGLILWEKLQSWRKHASFIYLVSVYSMMWSFTSALQYIILAVDVNDAPNQALAVVTYSFEIITLATSMNGLLIVAVYQYYRFKFHAYQKLTKYILYTGPSLVITIVMIIILVSSGSLAIIAITVLFLILIFIGIMGTTSLIAMYTELWFRTKNSQSLHGSLGRRVLIRRLILRLASYIYLAMVAGHLLTPLIKLAAKSDCVEEAQGSRAVWLSIQTIIKIFELFLVIQCLTVPQKVQNFTRKFWSARSNKKLPQYITNQSQDPTENLYFIESLNAEAALSTTNSSDVKKVYNSQKVAFETSTREHTPERRSDDSLTVTVHNCDPAHASAAKSSCSLVESVHSKQLCTVVEREILPQASSNNVDDRLQSYVNHETTLSISENLEHEFRDNQLSKSIFDELRVRFNHDVCMPSVDVLPGK